MKPVVTVSVSLAILFLQSCKYPCEYNPLLEPHGPAERGLEVLLPAARIAEADSVRAEALLLLGDGTKRPADGVAWESLTAEVLAVDGSGLVLGCSPGVGTIRARRGGLSATGELEVQRRVDFGRILLSEVFYDAAGSDEGREFMEIHNGNDYPVDLSGMLVTDGAASSSPFALPGGSAVPAGGRLVVASSRDGFFALFGAYPDLSGFSFSLNNSGETVRLMKADGTPVDAVFIAGGTADDPAPEGWCAAGLPSAAAGESVQRVSDEDTDTCGDWGRGLPTPWR